ncbi:MAG: hypothetical protein R8M46_05230 [Ghiorsea sp.]
MTLALSFFFFWLSLKILKQFKPLLTFKVKISILLLLSPLVIYPFMYGPVWWLRGLTGDLSILSLCLLMLAVYQQLVGKPVTTKHEQSYLKWGIVVTGLVLYPLALGLGSFDPYILGYASLFFAGLILIISLALFSFKCPVFASVLLLCILAWQMHMLQSVNLWDYLMDPFVFFFYVWRVIRCKS